MDANVPTAVSRGLERRGFDVIRAQDDGYRTKADEEILARVQQLGRALFTHDIDFVVEGSRRQADGVPFPPIIYVHQSKLTAGECVRQLEYLSKMSDPANLQSRVHFLPLRN